MKRERAPTTEEFEKLLAWIDPDSEQAGQKLLVYQSRITKIFISRGCVDAETLADEVVNRVTVRIDKVINNYPNPLQCLLGFVENVYREYLREEREHANAKPPPQPRPPEVLEREDECLNGCLGTLAQQGRELFSRYFNVDKRTKRQVRTGLAKERNLTANALRIHAHRLRKKLLECVQNCLERT